MRALLDINVLIALFDSDHTFHERAHAWWQANAGTGWSSCPLTENGLARIMSNPNYSQRMRLAPGDLISRLQTFAAQTNHEFWPDDLSLRDATVFAADRLHTSRQLTGLYLLAFAARHEAMLATFDERIPVSTVKPATERNWCVV